MRQPQTGRPAASRAAAGWSAAPRRRARRRRRGRGRSASPGPSPSTVTVASSGSYQDGTTIALAVAAVDAGAGRLAPARDARAGRVEPEGVHAHQQRRSCGGQRRRAGSSGGREQLLLDEVDVAAQLADGVLDRQRAAHLAGPGAVVVEHDVDGGDAAQPERGHRLLRGARDGGTLAGVEARRGRRDDGARVEVVDALEVAQRHRRTVGGREDVDAHAAATRRASASRGLEHLRGRADPGHAGVLHRAGDVGVVRPARRRRGARPAHRPGGRPRRRGARRGSSAPAAPGRAAPSRRPR